MYTHQKTTRDKGFSRMFKGLKGKTVIVTGGGSGIGRVTCLKLAELGANVSIVTQNEERGNETLRQVLEYGVKAIFIQADVSKEADVINFINKTVEEFGNIDGLFNNAGIEGVMKPLADYSLEEFENVIDVNLKSVFLGMKYAIPELIKNGGGTILNTSSHAGVVGSPFVSGYSATKHAVIGLTKTAVGEYSDKGITFNVICPGPTDTPMMQRFAEALTPDDHSQTERNVTSGMPTGKYVDPSDIADLACFLLSPSAKSITGAVHLVDGGITAL